MKNIVFQKLTGLAVLGTLAATTLLGISAQAAPKHPYNAKHPYSVNHRQTRQQHRIYSGTSNGSLTAREARHLEHREAVIRRAEARQRRDGGKFTWRERNAIERRENRVSRAIHQQKHDSQHR